VQSPEATDNVPWAAIENRCRLGSEIGTAMTATNVADLVAALRTFEHGKVVSAREAVALIRSGNTVATSGFVGIGFAENIAVALENRFVDSAKDDPDGVGSPRTSRSFTRRVRAMARSAVSITLVTSAS